MATSYEVPDLTVPIIACRSWNVSRLEEPKREILRPTPHGYGRFTQWEAKDVPKPRWVLSATGAGTAWQPGQFEAAHAGAVFQPREGHQVPAQHCSCGWWGLTSWDDLFTKFAGEFDKVLGTVRMWGRVVPGSSGWRAQYAAVDTLLLPDRKRPWSTGVSRRRVRALARAYEARVSVGLPELSGPWQGEGPWQETEAQDIKFDASVHTSSLSSALYERYKQLLAPGNLGKGVVLGSDLYRQDHSYWFRHGADGEVLGADGYVEGVEGVK